MGEWKEYKLGDVAIFKNGKSRPAEEGAFPIYGGNGILGYTNKFNSENEVVVIGRVGAYCGSVYIENKPIWISDNALLGLPKKGHDTRFLFYFLKNLNLNNFAEGSSHPLLTQSLLNSIDVQITDDINEQKSIASILSSLDNKIDLLQRQNKTLEALAETLFRKWFVEEAEEGWEAGKLGDVIELVYGKGLKEEIRTGRGFPVVGSSGVVGYHSEFLVEGPGIVIGRKGTLGKVIYLFENFFPIDTTYFIKSKVNSEGLFYEYFLLKTLNFEDMNTDSAVPGLNRELALYTEIIKPKTHKIKDFNNFCIPLFKKLKENNNQIRTLIRLRDTLLPKLMSGEVRVEPTISASASNA